MRILLTGGAGFIGSHAAEALVARGHELTVLDSLDPQVHGPGARAPENLRALLGTRALEFVRGCVEDRALVARLARRVDAVVHLAARVGVGQSGYEHRAYTVANALGTATLLDVLTHEPNAVERLVVASSMSSYGEGRGRNPRTAAFVAMVRPPERLRRGEWEPVDPDTGELVEPVPTPEHHPLEPRSIYGASKLYAEQCALLFGESSGVSTAALRFSNVFGPRQALINPYTGVIGGFGLRLSAGKAPLVFEDGKQARNFVHVRDAARAIVASVERSFPRPLALNIAAERSHTLLDVARLLMERLEAEIEPRVLGVARAGDVRYSLPDTRLAQAELGLTARERFEDGIDEIVARVRAHEGPELGAQAIAELVKAGRIHGDVERLRDLA